MASTKKARRTTAAASTTSNNILDRLPQDLIVEVVAQLAASSPSPLADLRSVRATCKQFREATAAGAVGRRVPMGREQSLRWWDKERYLAALASCASAGNSEAIFLLGLEHVFGGRRENTSDDDGIDDGVRFLVRANCDLAIYTFGVLLFGTSDEHDEKDVRQWGVDVLNELESGLHHRRCSHCASSAYVEECRRRVSAAIRGITMNKFYFDPRPGRHATCRDSTKCGRTTTSVKSHPAAGDCAWSGHQQQQFCSQICRWRDECCKFFNDL